MKRLIFFIGAHDTLDLFVEELSTAFCVRGYDTEILDVRNTQESLQRLFEYAKKPVTAAITFNNLVFNVKLAEGENIWEQLKIPCINILVDHPCFYNEALCSAPCNSIVLCMDKNHMKYVQRFYPNIPVSGFLPHAGCIHAESYKKLAERKIDVLYAGGLFVYGTGAARPDWWKYVKFDAKKLEDIVLKIMIETPALTFEAAVESALASQGMVLSDEEMRLWISEKNYIQGLAVSYYREAAVRTLVEAGIRVTVYGGGWDECSWASNPNLIYGGKISAREVLEKMLDTKIVLNTMTWFKDGTHDRVFNGMLAGAVAVTDTSDYMLENFVDLTELPGNDGYDTDNAQLAFFELNKLEKLSEKVKYLLQNLEQAQGIADRGHQAAKEQHTWNVRAEEIEEALFL